MRKVMFQIGGLVVAASAALTLAAVSPSFASPARPATASHTLKFTSVEKASVNLSKTMSAQQDTDHSSTGKVIGYDELYFATTSAKTADGWFTLDVDGGFLYGTFKLNLATGAITGGKVTGGARAFKGASGTLTATPVSSTKTAVKITYTT